MCKCTAENQDMWKVVGSCRVVMALLNQSRDAVRMIGAIFARKNDLRRLGGRDSTSVALWVQKGTISSAPLHLYSLFCACKPIQLLMYSSSMASAKLRL